MIKSNKYLGGLAVALASLTLLACNGGGGSSGGGLPPQPEYEFGSINSNSSSSTSCPTTVVLGKTCNAASSTFSLNITYSTTPASYLVIPAQASLSRGLTISQTGTCSTSPVANYSCNIKITAQNVASGTVVNIPIDGSLGQQSFYSVTYQ